MKVVLRDERLERDSRYLELRLEANGDVVLDGQDLGPAVEDFWGGSEYEWTITVKAPNVPILRAALGVGSDADILTEAKRRFEGAASRGFEDLLKTREIPVERWSRVGD